MVDSRRDVDSIVQNVVNSPQFRSLITDVIESSNQQSNPPAPTMAQTITTNALSASSSSSPATNNTQNRSVSIASRSQTTFASPVAEFNAIFRHGASASQQQQGGGISGGTVASFLPGIASYTARSRSRNSNGSLGRRSSSCSSRSKPPASNTFTREVILLSSPNASSVVKGKRKADLMRKGQVINSFDFCRSWSEDDVYRHLRAGFQDKLRAMRYNMNSSGL